MTAFRWAVWDGDDIDVDTLVDGLVALREKLMWAGEAGLVEYIDQTLESARVIDLTPEDQKGY